MEKENSPKTNISAVIVTYNRINLLKECIAAVLAQTYPCNKIIVVNNASTDETENFLSSLTDDRFLIFHLKKNTGGAGGFNFGIKKALEKNTDWVWLLDDDTIPNVNALEELISHANIVENTGFLCSRVLWTNGALNMMNDFTIPRKLHHIPWFQYIDHGICLVETATFVSCLVNTKAIEVVGLPIADFFIWSDDVEYTGRIVKKNFFGCFIKDSIVVHKTKKNQDSSLEHLEREYFWRVFYDIRNQLFMLRKEFSFPPKLIYMYIKSTIIFSKKAIQNPNGRFSLLSIVLKGFLASFFFFPKIEYVNRHSYPT
jgi:GT2 family glycosyltransferase